MKILSADIAMASRREQLNLQRTEERLTLTRQPPARPEPAGSVRVRLSPEALESPPRAEADTEASRIDARWLTLARMIEAITGIQIQVRVWQADGEGLSATRLDPFTGRVLSEAGLATGGWSLTIERTEIRYESETMVFAAQGSVQTADGRSLRFDMGLLMQREWLEARQVRLQMGAPELKDPLVLHLDGPAPTLTSTRFAFDLTGDGSPESIPFVGMGSGFLVWDRNGNGKADDGTELFGVRTGNGFAELAALDADGNGWIDQADPAFQALRVWQKDALGNDRFQRLEELGVGALYLGQVATPFSHRSASNEVLGQLRATGLYLKSNGTPGLMQQIDLAV